MNWKSWPNKKIGIIFAVIGLLLGLFVTLPLFSRGIAGGLTGGGGGSGLAVIMYAFIFSTPIAIVFYWVGSFVDWLYGKIKNRNSVSPPSSTL